MRERKNIKALGVKNKKSVPVLLFEIEISIFFFFFFLCIENKKGLHNIIYAKSPLIVYVSPLIYCSPPCVFHFISFLLLFIMLTSDPVKPILVNNVNEVKSRLNSLKVSTNHLSLDTVWSMSDFELKNPIGIVVNEYFLFLFFLI